MVGVSFYRGGGHNLHQHQRGSSSRLKTTFSVTPVLSTIKQDQVIEPETADGDVGSPKNTMTAKRQFTNLIPVSNSMSSGVLGVGDGDDSPKLQFIRIADEDQATYRLR